MSATLCTSAEFTTIDVAAVPPEYEAEVEDELKPLSELAFFAECVSSPSRSRFSESSFTRSSRGFRGRLYEINPLYCDREVSSFV